MKVWVMVLGCGCEAQRYILGPYFKGERLYCGTHKKIVTITVARLEEK